MCLLISHVFVFAAFSPQSCLWFLSFLTTVRGRPPGFSPGVLSMLEQVVGLTPSSSSSHVAILQLCV